MLSVVLALGVQRMAKHHAIVKKLSSVETLGSASVICTDKTGTLTRNEMTIERIVTGSGEVEVSGSGYRPEGDVRIDGRPLDDPVLLDEVACRARGRQPGQRRRAAAKRTASGRYRAIRPMPRSWSRRPRWTGSTEERRSRFERVGEVPFTSERKLMSTLQLDAASETGIAVVTKGAPDVLLARCTEERRRRRGGAARPRPAGQRSCRRRLARRPALRTLAVAYRRLPAADAPGPPDESVERELIYLGTVGILDPPRPEAKAAIAEAQAAGVRVIMITGDHPRTAARIAADLGIAGGDRRPLTGAELERLDDDALARRGARRVGVCARRAGAQAADRRRAPGRRAHRRDDRRRGQRRPRAEGGRHRRRHGHHRHRRGQGGGGHDPRRRQLRHDRRAPSARGAASSPTSGRSCASCSRRTSARC